MKQKESTDKCFTNFEDSPLKTKVKNIQPTRTSIKGTGGGNQHFMFHLHDFTNEQGYNIVSA